MGRSRILNWLTHNYFFPKQRFQIAMRLVEHAHQVISDYIHPNDFVIDATVGNGYDTAFLAEQVGPNGIVYGFDLQTFAIESTQTILKTNNFLDRCQLFQTGHEHIRSNVPNEQHGKISGVMFNLGYLPHGDKSVITQPTTTLLALAQSLELLKPDGVISILAYRGHEGGMEEYEAVLEWLEQADRLTPIHKKDSVHSKKKGPFFWLYQKTNPTQ